MDQAASLRYAGIVFASVHAATATPGPPIANARVTIVDEDAALGEIHYATIAAGAPAMTELVGAAATDARGLFVAYMDRPITVSISAPGYLTREVRLAAADFIFGATTIVLRPQ